MASEKTTCLGVASIFIHQVEERGKKDGSPLKKFPLAIDEGVGEGESGPAPLEA